MFIHSLKVKMQVNLIIKIATFNLKQHRPYINPNKIDTNILQATKKKSHRIYIATR